MADEDQEEITEFVQVTRVEETIVRRSRNTRNTPKASLVGPVFVFIRQVLEYLRSWGQS